MKFKDTIGVFKNAFTEKECNELSKRIDNVTMMGNVLTKIKAKYNKNIRNCIDYNIMGRNNPVDNNLTKLVNAKFNHFTEKYLSEFPHNDIYHHGRIVYGSTYFPLFQIQKYKKMEGHYNAWHVEKESITSNRMFVYILYLNTVEEGGQTGFLFKERKKDKDFFKVKPEVGKLIIHPCSWPYIHKGYMPESSDKYILTTWLQYEDPFKPRRRK